VGFECEDDQKEDWIMVQILLSVVIGTYNRIEVLKQCLDSLIGKIAVTNEIIVIDAGSTDNTREYLRDLQGVKVICDEGLLGQARSLNRVIRSLKSKYVCWLSDDNIAQPGILDQAVSILEHDSKIGVVALKVRDISGPFIGEEYVGGIWPTGVLNCNQGILPVALLNRIGGFDEQFRDYGIDSDLTTRVLLEGYKVVYTKRVAIHHLRDHDAHSWIDSNGRKQKMEYARELYGQKFDSLLKSEVGQLYNKATRENSLPLRIILLWYGRARKLGIPLYKWTSLTERDWKNLFTARFISKLDFLINMKKPYYLVQHIPDELLRELAG
jgi:GT2 family glycosyltransferase